VVRQIQSEVAACELSKENEALRAALSDAMKQIGELEGEKERFMSEDVFDLVNSLCRSELPTTKDTSPSVDHTAEGSPECEKAQQAEETDGFLNVSFDEVPAVGTKASEVNEKGDVTMQIVPRYSGG